jgi:uncharacterized protein HemX
VIEWRTYFDLEKARQYFKRQLHQLSDYFVEEKYPDEIKSIKIAIQLIEKEIKNGDLRF